jgi:hypothetical protein
MVWDVLLTPFVTVIVRLAGADAVIVAFPGALQVAWPVLLSMVAIAVFELDHCRLSATVSSRLLPLLNIPRAVKPTSPSGLCAVADAGLICTD